MKIEFVPCYSDRALFMRMAKDYVETLHKHDSSIRWDEPTWEKAVWESEFILEDRTIQGFVLKEEVKFTIYADLLYIAELYVVPEARRRGVGRATVKALTDNWGGDVFLYIIKGNFPATVFWNTIEQEFGWKRIERPEIRQERGCELRVYEQSVNVAKNGDK